MSSTRKVGICRAPGGLPGLDAHLGVWAALDAAGVQPTHVYGASAGAIISALQAAGKTCGEVVDIIRGLADRDVIRKRFAWKSRIFWIDHFCDPAPIQKLIWSLLPAAFEDLQLRCTVTATRMDPEGETAVAYSHGECLREAVLASMSIAGVWPYAPVAGHPHTDGGTTDALYVPSDLETFDEFWFVNFVHSRSYKHRDKNMISRLIWNVDRLCEAERNWTRDNVSLMPNVRWLDIDIGDGSCLSFDHDLIITASVQAARKLFEWGYR